MNNVVCPFCKTECDLVTDNVAECLVCEEFFEVEDELFPKQIRTKPKRNEEEDWDGF